MTKIDFSTTLTDLKGKPIYENKEEGKLLALGDIVSGGLLAISDGDKNMSSSDKLRCFKLAMKAEGIAEISVTDIAFILKRLGTILTPLMLGRVHEILDPDSLKDKD